MHRPMHRAAKPQGNRTVERLAKFPPPHCGLYRNSISAIEIKPRRPFSALPNDRVMLVGAQTGHETEELQSALC